METARLRADAPFWVGDHLVEPVLNRATVGGVPASVEPRVMAVLAYLARRPGEVVSRDELLDTVWADVVVNEDALTRAVSELRKLFGDDPREPSVVQTIRGRGYRLIAPVRPAHVGDGFSGDGAVGGNGAATPVPVPPPAAPPVRPRRAPWLALAVGVAVGVAGVAALAAWASSRADAPAADAGFGPAEPFTSYPGQEIEPAISPEGARVAFAWDGGEGEGYDVYVKQPSREAALRLTDHPAQEGSPAWSPDGSEVAFLRYGDEHGVYVVPSLGGAARRLYAVPEPGVAHGLDWSPDGASLAFSVDPGDGNRHIRMLDLATGEVDDVTAPGEGQESDIAPRFSPDGRRIAFARSGYVGGRDLIVRTLATGDERRVATDQIGVRGLDWVGPEALVFASYRTGTFGLWRVDLGAGEPAWIPAPGEWAHSPSVAAQTGALVYQNLAFEKNVWRIRLDGPGGRVLGAEPVVVSTHFDCEARLSPDGERLAFASSRSGSYQVWVSDADGRDPTAVTSFGGGASVGNPHWSPDGRRIAFSANPEGASAVYVVDAAGGPPRQATPAGWNALLTGWAGDAVTFASDHGGSWQLWRAEVGGAPVQVTTDGALFGAESLDGRWLYSVRPDAPGIWRTPLAAGRAAGAAELVVEEFPIRWARDWVLVDDGLYFLQRVDGALHVAFHDFETGEARTVSEVVRIASPSLAASPDGATLLYGRIERSESDVYLLPSAADGPRVASR